MPLTPEQQARQEIDATFAGAGWTVQDRDGMNLAAGLGVAVQEFRMATGYGFADYTPCVNRQAVGAWARPRASRVPAPGRHGPSARPSVPPGLWTRDLVAAPGRSGRAEPRERGGSGAGWKSAGGTMGFLTDERMLS